VRLNETCLRKSRRGSRRPITLMSLP
jgi:hypothetical protein